ncbi:MAG: sialidase family protein [Actinomycetota bacterium]|nr:sialidase family protein [Actinomycetota bacterium]
MTPQASAALRPATAPGFSPISATFISPVSGFVLGSVPCAGGRCFRLLYTRDDGARWNALALPTSLGRPSAVGGAEVRFATARDGWIFVPLGQTNRSPSAFVTHDGGRQWSPLRLPVTGSAGIEDLEAAHGVVHAAVQSGSEVELYSAPVTGGAWRRNGPAIPLGAGPVPAGQLALQANSGAFVQNDRVVGGGARLMQGRWVAWHPPCVGRGGPAILAKPLPTRIDVLCAEGIWTGKTPSIHLLESNDGGRSFPLNRVVPASALAADFAAIGPRLVVVASTVKVGGGALPVLLLSDNGGSTWRRVASVRGAGWIQLGLTTLRQGFAIVSGRGPGAGNTMVMTRDAGASWQPVRFSGA